MLDVTSNIISYVSAQYLQILIFLLSAFGFGQIFARSLKAESGTGLFLLFSLATGQIVLMCFVQFLGIFGVLNLKMLSVPILAGVSLSVASVLRHQKLSWMARLCSAGYNVRQFVRKISQQPRQKWVFFAIFSLISVELLLRPLQPPLVFDEVMYHLPHVRLWLEQGDFSIHPWLRYPYFPYNFNLLYCFGLAIGNDVFPHLIHASAGWITISGLWLMLKRESGDVLASIATILFSVLIFGHFSGAMIDLGLMMVVFYGFLSTYFWLKSTEKNQVHLYFAALFFGAAVGMKYQAMPFMALFFLLVLWKVRSLPVFLKITGLALLPCAYWYIRNYLLTGNPVAPMFPSMFGLADWNASDMAVQLTDIRNHRDWPSIVLWPALAMPFMYPLLNKSLWWRWVTVFSVFGCIVWIATSHYSRYLLPIFPFLCAMSAWVIVHAVRWLASRFSTRIQHVLAASLAVISVLAFGVVSARSAMVHVQRIVSMQQDLSAYLRTKVRVWDSAEVLKKHPEWTVLHLDFSSDMYYLPSNARGDIFGPARMSDFVGLTSAELVVRMRKVGANTLLLAGSSREIAKSRGYPVESPSDAIRQQPDFHRNFELVHSSPESELYLIR